MVRRRNLTPLVAVFAVLPYHAGLATSCHPSYLPAANGSCVPDVGNADVDCAYANTAYQRGNGPFYAFGPFERVGPDVYGLDGGRHGKADGLACEWSNKA